MDSLPFFVATLVLRCRKNKNSRPAAGADCSLNGALLSYSALQHTKLRSP